MAADMVSLAVAFEEISRGWMGVAGIIGSHSLSCWMIARFGTEEQKQAHLPALASGERRTGIALTEPGAGSDLQGIQATARQDGDSYVLTGTEDVDHQRAARRPAAGAGEDRPGRGTGARRACPCYWWTPPRPASR